MAFRRDFSTPVGLLDRSSIYDAQGRKGSPNIYMHEGALNCFHRFDVVNPGTEGATLGFPILAEAEEDKYDLFYFWAQFENIMAAFTNSRNIITVANFVDYIRKVTELSSHIHSLLGMKKIYDMDWAAIFNEQRPREITILGEDLMLADAAFEQQYGDVLRAARAFRLPSTLVNMLAHFHSPFYLSSEDVVHVVIAPYDEITSISGASAMKTLISNFVNLLTSTPVYQKVNSLFHIAMLSEPCFKDVLVLQDAGAYQHVNGLLNRAGGTTSENASIFETNVRPVSFWNTYSNCVDLSDPSNYGSTTFGPYLNFGFWDGTESRYMYTVAGDPIAEHFLYTPFYQRYGTAYARAARCYNHGLANYDRIATIDVNGIIVEFATVPIQNIPGGSPSVSIDGLAVYDMISSDAHMWPSVQAWATGQVPFVGTAPARIYRDYDIPEMAMPFTAVLSGVSGIFFELVSMGMLDATGISFMQDPTRLAQVRTTSPGIKLAK